MPGSKSRGSIATAIAGLLLICAGAADAARAEPVKAEAPTPTPVDMQKRMEIYRKKLAEYTKIMSGEIAQAASACRNCFFC